MSPLPIARGIIHQPVSRTTACSPDTLPMRTRVVESNEGIVLSAPGDDGAEPCCPLTATDPTASKERIFSGYRCVIHAN